eukprot:TRINITY_DN1776_c1_g1_i2.p2 TRINITY_DN1776_c1_g1~~TRINITY_DN1776_c1_g1_i2.p2  ORF type:complete len:101 (+),score=5.44 TRINITY_DN1776_c1_g1_i2:22-324(+)
MTHAEERTLSVHTRMFTFRFLNAFIFIHTFTCTSLYVSDRTSGSRCCWNCLCCWVSAIITSEICDCDVESPSTIEDIILILSLIDHVAFNSLFTMSFVLQ